MTKRPVKKQIKKYNYRRKDGKFIRVPTHKRTYYISKVKFKTVKHKAIRRQQIKKRDWVYLSESSSAEVYPEEVKRGRSIVKSSDDVKMKERLEKILSDVDLKRSYIFQIKTIPNMDEMYRRYKAKAIIHHYHSGKKEIIVTKQSRYNSLVHEVAHLVWDENPQKHGQYIRKLRGRSKFSPDERFARDFEVSYLDHLKKRESKTESRQYIREEFIKN